MHSKLKRFIQLEVLFCSSSNEKFSGIIRIYVSIILLLIANSPIIVLCTYVAITSITLLLLWCRGGSRENF